MKNKIGLNDFLIVIVLYNKNLYESETFKSLIENAKTRNEKVHLFVYDNSLNSYQHSIESNYCNVKYKHDPNNSGVSKAYNEGFDYAKSKNKKWVMLFDQDTNLPSNYISTLIEAMFLKPEIGLFSPILKFGCKIISPLKIKFQRGKGIKKIESGIKALKNFSIINSGLCMKTDLFFKTEGYNEQIRLDFSDISFIRRLSKVISHFFLVPIVVEHDLSAFHKNAKSALNRFEIYCTDAINYAHEFDVLLQISIVIILRGFKLALKYRNVKFIITSIRNIR